MTITTIFDNTTTKELAAELIHVYTKNTLPDIDSYQKLLKQVKRKLLYEANVIRPHNKAGFPGGIVYLKKNLPTIIIPDLHARMDFFLNVLFYKDSTGLSNLQKLGLNLLQIVCVGDGFHAEERAQKRWLLALEEFNNEYEDHKNIDQEMKESFNLMEMVMRTKIAFPEVFHFLKGNHENIANETNHGNHPFRKFAFESPMVTFYVKNFYGEAFLQDYSKFEKCLPIIAVGRNFLVSHAQPLQFYDKETLIEYWSNPDAIEGLTWTDNDLSKQGTVQKMLKYYIDPMFYKNSLYFAGHRAIKEKYSLLEKGRFVQLHNPDKFSIANIQISQKVNLDNIVMELKNNIKQILKSSHIRKLNAVKL